MYKKLEYSGTGTLQLDIPAMEEWIMKTFRENLSVQISSPKVDFFAAGVNSLKAIQVRAFRNSSNSVSILGHKTLLGRTKLFWFARTISVPGSQLFSRFRLALFLDSLSTKSDADSGVCVDEGPHTETPRYWWQQ